MNALLQQAPDSAFQFTPWEELLATADDLRFRYLSGEPFPNLVIDGLFDPDILDRVRNDATGISTERLNYWNTTSEKKYTTKGDNGLSNFTRTFLYHLTSPPMIRAVEKITGIQGMVADPAPGLHLAYRGGWLGIHADTNFHAGTDLQRRLNLFIYLNRDWQEQYNGHLEFWNRSKDKCVKKITPVFNRAVLFPVTNYTFHGHPEPLLCPQEAARVAIGVSYYTKIRPRDEGSRRETVAFVNKSATKIPRSSGAWLRRCMPPILIDLARSLNVPW
jgi:hypothetical protein